MKKAVISGATGAIGMALIKRLLEENVKILILCRKDSPRLFQIPRSPLIDIDCCSLEEYETYQKPGDENFDTFYHFAWDGTFGVSRNDMYLQNRNVRHTLDAVRLAKRLGCHTFIGAGSQAEYGRVEGILTPSTPTFPENGYGIAKLCAGQMSRVLCHELGMKHIWTRVLSVYGPYDADYTMIMSTIIKLINGETPKFTKGEQVWDYMYSGDAANAFYLLGEKGIDGKIYVLGSGNARPLKDFILELRDVINPKAEIELGTVPYVQNQVMYLSADTTELINDTGICGFTEFKDGISETIRYIIDAKR